MRLAGLRELAAREDERAVLAGVRLELESLRIMCDRVSRRERLKRECELFPGLIAFASSCRKNLKLWSTSNTCVLCV